MSEAADRTIPATPRRRQQARREGLLPTATLPAWGATVAVTLLLLPAWWRATVTAATAHFRVALASAGLAPPLHSEIAAAASPAAWLPLGVILPTIVVALVAAITGLAVRGMIDGLQWCPQHLLPTAGRIAPLAGLKRIFSSSTLLSAASGGGWMAGLLMVAAWSSGRTIRVIATADLPTPSGLALVAGAIPEAIGALSPLLAATVVVAVGRWIGLRLAAERRLRMTPEELREEMRSLEAAHPVSKGNGRAGAARSAPPPGQLVAGAP
jgi:flagellar biosynthetic protein FlhB